MIHLAKLIRPSQNRKAFFAINAITIGVEKKIKAHYDTEIRPTHAITIRGSVSLKERLNYIKKPTLNELDRKLSVFSVLSRNHRTQELVQLKQKYFFFDQQKSNISIITER